MKTPEKIINRLKVNGPQTAKMLAEALNLTTMGVRQHVQQLEEDGDVIFEDRKATRGRPVRYWSLTPQSNTHFADGHELLTVQLLDSVKTVFGENGLDQLITQREKDAMKIYHQKLDQHQTLKDKLKALAEVRSEEGYMAEIKQEKGIFWLLENHCPICSAASHCLNFCRSELKQFQSLFKGLAVISREEHILQGARRCAYKVTPVEN